jgi:Family of unknown function (DUF6529)
VADYVTLAVPEHRPALRHWNGGGMTAAGLGQHPPTGGSTVRRLAWVIAVTAALAVFGAEHSPNYTFGLFGSSGTGAISLKSRISTGILALALVQLLLALWMYGRVPGVGAAPSQVGRLHRATGIVLFLATLPVAVHCMVAYGVQTTSARVTVHSLAGCFFYGAFLSKILVVRSRQLPGWVLPTAGGVLVAVIAVLWYSSALWFFNGYQLPGG